MTYKMKVAIVHDALIEYGGGEKVLELLAAIFPQADIYTSVFNEQALAGKIETDFKRIKSSCLSSSFLANHPILISYLAPIIWLSFDLSAYDVIISHGGFYSSHLIAWRLKADQRHLHYAISYPPVFGRFFKKTSQILAVSRKIATDFVNQGYQGELKVLYPPVKSINQNKSTKQSNYYVYLGRLEKSKNLALLIEAFNHNQLELKIIGSGSQEKCLKKIAKKNIQFLGYKSQLDFWPILQGARAMIHPALNEDFGIAPLEAQACGLPVIAFRGGALVETVIDGETGTFFDDNDAQSLNEAIKKLDSLNIKSSACIKQAKKFSPARFKQQLKTVLEN